MAEEHEIPHNGGPTTVRRKSGWDFFLMMLTVGLLGALGAQSLLGTLYAWWGYRTQPDFELTAYPAFIVVMNSIAAPLVVALVVVMGLCVPKRLLARRTLATVSVAMVGVGVATAAASASVATGLAVYLGLAALIQVAVVALTLAGVRSLGYLSENRVARIGSGLLHLGFILFALVVVALQKSPYMLPVFYASATLLAGGSGMSFYARSSSRAPAPDEGARD
jgi:peptidoglycan/LPS O-acetylase OafA/YrhL